MSQPPLGQSDPVYQYQIRCLSILSFVEDCGNQPLSPVINHAGRPLAAQYRSGGREVEELTEDGEVEADGEGEMKLDETECIGEETGYLEDHEEGMIAL